ncbi:WD40-repeat-containing domain protein [Phlyctochytrium arcticum]|nr:WD40-repeat-containing domain protein [Phlyctochytrium arcticum]
MVETTKDLELTALAVVAAFLRQKNLTATLQCLEIEAQAQFAELNAHPTSAMHKPLLAMLEKQELDDLEKKMSHISVDQESEKYLKSLKGGLLPKQPSTSYEGVHFANILSVATAPCPSDLQARVGESDRQVTIAATGSTDKSVKITDIATGKVIASLNHHEAAVLAIDFYPSDRNYILTGGMDGKLHIADIRTGESVQSWKDHTKYVVRARFSVSGTWLATASYDRSVQIYRQTKKDAGHPEFERVHTLMFDGPVEALCFLSSEKTGHPFETIVIGTRDDNHLHCIDLDPTQAFPDTKINMNSNGDNWVSFTPMDIVPSPDERILAVYTDSKAGRIILFETRTNRQIRNLWNTVADGFSQPRCCWDSSGRHLFATSDDRQIYVYDVVTGQELAKLDGHTNVIRAITFDTKVKKLVSCSFDRTVRVWDTISESDSTAAEV